MKREHSPQTIRKPLPNIRNVFGTPIPASMDFANEPVVYQGQWLTYHFYVNHFSYLSEFNIMSAMSIATAIILLMLALLFVFGTKRILYDPVGNILHLLDSDWKNSNVGQNEFFMIINAIDQMQVRLEEFNDAIPVMKEDLRVLAFNRLACDEASVEVKAQIDLRSLYFCALVVLFEDEQGEKDYAAARDFMVELATYEHYQVYTTDKFNVYYVLLDDIKKHLSLVNHVNTFMKQNSCYCQCGISSMHNDVDNINAALEEGLRAFYEVPVEGLAAVKKATVYDNLLKHSGCKISMGSYNKFTSASLSGDVDKVTSAVTEVLDENNSASALDKRQLLLFLHRTVRLLFGTEGQVHPNDHALDDIYNLELLHSRIKADLTRQILGKNEGCKISRWVHENLHSDISLADFASAMQFSYSYASRFFTHETGMNFTEYLQKARIEASMRKLIETDKTIEDIARDTGFISINTFFRAFKKHAGITPNSYRNTVRAANM